MKKHKIDPNQTIKHNNIEFKFKDLVDYFLKSNKNVNHEIYRKVVKKVQRKFFRQQNSKLVNQLETNYPIIKSRSVQNDSAELERTDVNDENEAKSLKEHNLWMERERLAQIEWKAKKQKEERYLKRVEEEKLKFKERESKKVKSLNSIKSKRNEEQEQTVHNPILNLPNLDVIQDTREKCGYFLKTGVCRYGNLCNKSHSLNSNQLDHFTTLIIPGMYTHMLLGYELLNLDNDTDEALEYEESDLLEHFKNFYDDTLSEFKKYGKIVQFLVCSNCQAHLRGNVYVQYNSEEEANKAYIELNGRFYAGKQIYCYFTHVKNWKDAVCGAFLRKKCDKGQKCNYMHVFRNPYNEFQIENFKKFNSAKFNNSNSQSKENLYSFKNTWSSDDETWNTYSQSNFKENIKYDSNIREKHSKDHESSSYERKSKHHHRHRKRSHSRSSKSKSHKKSKNRNHH